MSKEFDYSYTAFTESERKQAEAIREQYLQKSEKSALHQLESLDKKVKNVPTAVAIVIGIVGCLIFGLGLACVLEFGELAWGIVIAVAGCVVMAAAHLAYGVIFSALKRKYGKQILEISERIINSQAQFAIENSDDNFQNDSKKQGE